MDDVAAYNLRGGLTVVAQIALIVLTMIWLFRIAKNHQALGRRLTWAPGLGDRRLVPAADPVRHPDR